MIIGKQLELLNTNISILCFPFLRGAVKIKEESSGSGQLETQKTTLISRENLAFSICFQVRFAKDQGVNLVQKKWFSLQVNYKFEGSKHLTSRRL